MTAFFVAGVPVEQGSKKGFSRAGSTFVQIVDNNKDRLRPWRSEVARVAAVTFAYGQQLEGPVTVEAVFVMPRPASVKREYPHVRPDLDKLLRALCDGITDAGCVWKDDSQVVSIVASKVYGQTPGVHVLISAGARAASPGVIAGSPAGER